MIKLTERGTKLAIHAQKTGFFTHLRQAAEQGTPYPAVKMTQELTALADVKRDSPGTLTIARKPHEHDGLQGIANEGRMTTARAIEWANVVMSHAFEYLGKNPDLVQHIDIYELVNEPDPHNVDGWYNLGAIMRECVALGRERYPSIAWGIGSWNAGTPEVPEMKAFLESGVLDGAPDDVVLTIHEGVLNPGDPIDKGQGDLIPGADSVPEHGGSLMGRIAYFAELAGDDMVPVVVSEAYLQGYGDANDAAERMRQMDAFYANLWYVVAFCPFTHSPTPQWQGQDYTPAHALLFGYMADVADRENATKPEDEPDPPPPPEPEPTDWRRLVWEHSLQEQQERGIVLHPDFALQQMIFAREGYTPVTREVTVQDEAGNAYGYMAAEHLAGEGPRIALAFQRPWAGPGGVEVLTEEDLPEQNLLFSSPVGTEEERDRGELWN